VPPSPPEPRRRLLRALLLAIPALALAAGAAVVFGFRRAPELPVYYDLPAFELVDHHGRAVDLSTFQGHPSIVAFIFTRCGGVCPAMTARMLRLQSKLPASTRYVSITVDPAHDTREVLKAYAAQVGAGDRWTFVTGSQKELYRLAIDGFKLEALELPPDRPDPLEGPFLHSSKLVLVDGRGRVRGYYDSADDEAMERLTADTARLGEAS
jgi:protein SCO1/2